MDLFLTIGTYVLAVYMFLFLFWKKLKEDYLSSQIFTSSLFSLLGLLVFVFLFARLNSSWWFWWAFFGSIIGLFFAVSRFNLKLFEAFEAWVNANLASLIVLSLIKSLLDKGTENIFILGLVLAFYLIYVFVDKNYKKFTWYKSGRVGFSGVVVFALFFLCRFVVALFYPSMISFVGTGELLLSGGMVLISLVLYINLAKLEK